MDFNQEILSKIQILNQILEEYDLPHVLENKNFSIDEISCESYLKLSLKKETSELDFEIIISPQGMEINLSNAHGIISWSNDYIDKFNERVIKSLKELLSSYILINRRGKNFTQIFFFNQEGICVNKIKYINGISLTFRSQKQLYPPIVSIY